MKALFLEDVEQLAVQQVPEPRCSEHEVLVQIRAVGVCGTDFHIYRGAANYNFDTNGRPIPLRLQPQILGHEFCGTLLEVGAAVPDLRPGDRVVVDQGLNCFSQQIAPPCTYCCTGHSHQCLNYKERGITGLPGALQEIVAMPAVNAVPTSPDLPFEELALVEPLGCVIHSMDMVQRAHTRFSLFRDRPEAAPVEHLLILGAGPAGLLFLQYIKRVRQFKGQILVADSVEKKLQLAQALGAIPIDISDHDLVSRVRELTKGHMIDFLVEASGSGKAFERMPAVLKKQATVVLYGHGHRGTDLSVLNHLLFLEPTLIAAVGASGELDPRTHRPRTFQRAQQMISSGSVRVKALITHHYQTLEAVEQAFQEDAQEPDYIKGVLTLA